MPVTRARSDPKQDRSRFTVSAILEATERLLVSARGARLSARTIARVAGVSVGTLYQYFPGRDAMIARVIERRLADDQWVMLEAFHSHRGLPIAQLVWRSLDAALPKTSWELALYPEMVDRLREVERHEHVQRFLQRFENLWHDELTQRRDELRPGLDPRVAATTSMHAMRGAMLAFARQDPPLDRSAMIAHLADLGSAYLTGR